MWPPPLPLVFQLSEWPSCGVQDEMHAFTYEQGNREHQALLTLVSCHE